MSVPCLMNTSLAVSRPERPYGFLKLSIFAASTKSDSVSPSILWVQI